MADGQPEAGLAKLEQSIQTSPKAHDMYVIKYFQASALLGLQRYAEAEQAALAALQANDSWWAAWSILARARAAKGDIKGAQAALYKAREKEPTFSLESTKRALALIYKDKGRHALSIIEPIWPEDLLTADNSAPKE